MDIQKLKQVAWIGEEFVKDKIRGVVLFFHGLGYANDRKSLDFTFEREWANAGWLVVFPYYGPWSWMNREAREFTDKLVDSVYENYSLNKAVPLISTGASMGGHAALLYTCYARNPVSACLALFPVCDLKYHFSERPDIPKTIHHAFRGYKEDMEELFIEHSPVNQVSRMPDIPYLIIHGEADSAVSKARHSDVLAYKMREKGMNLEYIEVPGMDHNWDLPLIAVERMSLFVTGYK